MRAEPQLTLDRRRERNRQRQRCTGSCSRTGPQQPLDRRRGGQAVPAGHEQRARARRQLSLGRQRAHGPPVPAGYFMDLRNFLERAA
ncbi:hypothetical protein T492DRAFT_1076061 [Pavlovales sp. CCMP2436]|nr:hypothetical protein T492DRAFT_1076061 [Pavlovales sp. CCMP2436]